MKTIPQMVKWPQMGSSGEGGLAVYLLIPRDVNRAACYLYATASWSPGGDVFTGPKVEQSDMDAALLIGSTGNSYYDRWAGDYFHATYEDLTSSGKRLYDALEQIYGEKPAIVTILDT